MRGREDGVGANADRREFLEVRKREREVAEAVVVELQRQ